ncbi:MAG: hypothetical protein ABI180_02780 [Microcoleus sp.]
MKIRCIANTGASLPDDYIEPAIGYTKDIQFSLTIGQEYVVYAFGEWRGTIWYYICDDNYSYYPMQNPAPLFEVIDDRVSKYWRFKLSPNGFLMIAFEQWFTDPYFYDKLTDYEEAEVEIFEKVKELMDAENFDLPPMEVAVEKLRETVGV